MTDTPSPSTGRFIRVALVGLPVGLILTSILSFGIWWQKKQSAEERTFAYATALRRDMTLPALDRYTSILNEVMQPQGRERLAAVSSFVESSMSPENMGYSPRRDRFYDGGLEFSNVDVEITGNPRAREIRLILVPFGDPTRTEAEVQALAGFMALGHALAGSREENTLRLAAVPLGVKDEHGNTALQRFAASCTGRQERVIQIILPGGVPEPLQAEIHAAFRTSQTGALVEVLPASKTKEETLKMMTQLLGRL